MEDTVLQNLCGSNKWITASRYISIASKEETGREDLEWADIERYLRVLGITTKDLCESKAIPSENNYDIELKVLFLHKRICLILGSENPVEAVKKIKEISADIECKTNKIKDKKLNCMNAIIKNFREITSKISELTGDRKEDESPYNEEFLRLKNAELKVKSLMNDINKELYNKNTAEALNIIRDEIETTYEEYNDVRMILKERITPYEDNQQLLQMLKKYTELKRRIKNKKEDIISISQ